MAPRIDVAADSLTRYFQQRQRRGFPEARRDWLYAPAYVPGGAWDADQQLDNVIRRAKDRGVAIGFEIWYVYDRPPVWTCEPSDYIRQKAVVMPIKGQATAEERLTDTLPSASALALVTAGLAASLRAAELMVDAMGPAFGPPANDPVLNRIDAIPGLAN